MNRNIIYKKKKSFKYFKNMQTKGLKLIFWIRGVIYHYKRTICFYGFDPKNANNKDILLVYA